MRARVFLALACLVTLQASSQDTSKADTVARCKFSDGRAIKVLYLPEHEKTARLFTDVELVISSSSAGLYPGWHKISVGRNNSWNDWALSVFPKGMGGVLLRLSVAKPALPVKIFNISFDQTGRTCTMNWNSKASNVLLSLEFVEKNTDIPVRIGR